MQSTILILGARGRFGLAAVRAFADAGWRVLAQARVGGNMPAIRGVQWLHLPLSEHLALAQAAHGAAVVLHAINAPYTKWGQEAIPALEQAINLATELKALFMLPGNVYNFGTQMPAVLTEDTPELAQTRKGKIRVAMEQRLRQASKSGTLRSVVIRAGDFFGNGKGSWFDLAVAKNIQKGKLTYPGVWNTPTAWAYLPDLATTFERVAKRALETPQNLAAFEVFHFKGYSLTGADWAAVLEPLALNQGWLAAAPLKKGAMPWGMIKALSWLVPMFAELAEMHYLWHTAHSLENHKLVSLIGPEPHTELAQAVKSALIDLGLITTTHPA